jgi:hypothetical protein
VWNHREHAIKAVANELQRCADQPDIGPRTLYRVLIPLLKRLLNDKVPQVFLGAVGVFERLTVDYCGDQKKDEVQRQVEGLLPVLVKRLDDANARVRAAALKTCLALRYQFFVILSH